MGKGDNPGEFELVVMLALVRLDEAAYGMAVYDEVVATTGRDVSVQAVYVTLKRMENKGFLRADQSESDGGGGREKREYSITPAGMAVLRQARLMYDRLWAGVQLEPGSGAS